MEEESKFIEIVSYDKHQHYKDRNMPWIKWRTDSLMDMKFMGLDPVDRWVFVGLLSLAPKCDNKIELDYTSLNRVLNVKDAEKSIHNLLSIGCLDKVYTDSIDRVSSHNRRDKIRVEEKRKEEKREDMPEKALISPRGDGSDKSSPELKSFKEIMKERRKGKKFEDIKFN